MDEIATYNVYNCKTFKVSQDQNCYLMDIDEAFNVYGDKFY